MKGRTGNKSLTKHLMRPPHGPLHTDKPMKRGGKVTGEKAKHRADKKVRKKG